jgi:hypothetical protein
MGCKQQQLLCVCQPVYGCHWIWECVERAAASTTALWARQGVSQNYSEADLTLVQVQTTKWFAAHQPKAQ